MRRISSSPSADGEGNQRSWWRGYRHQRSLPLHHRICVRWFPSPRAALAGRNALRLRFLGSFLGLRRILGGRRDVVGAFGGSFSRFALGGRSFLASRGLSRRFLGRSLGGGFFSRRLRGVG